MPDQRSSRRRIEVTVSWATILKLLAAVLLAYLGTQLWPLLALLFVALLIAITLFPILQWTRCHRWPDWLGILIIGLLLFLSVILFAGFLIPTVGNEASGMLEKLPSFQKGVVDRTPSPVLRDAVNKVFESASFSNPEPLLKQFVAWGTVAVRGLAEFLIVLVVAVYESNCK